MTQTVSSVPCAIEIPHVCAVIEYQNDGLLPQALVNYLVRLG